MNVTTDSGQHAPRNADDHLFFCVFKDGSQGVVVADAATDIPNVHVVMSLAEAARIQNVLVAAKQQAGPALARAMRAQELQVVASVPEKTLWQAMMGIPAALRTVLAGMTQRAEPVYWKRVVSPVLLHILWRR